MAVIAGAADADPELYPAAFGQDQRGLQHQFLYQRAPGLIAGADRQFGERRAGQQDVPGDLVVSQPGMGSQ